jgi:hypothetical protein
MASEKTQERCKKGRPAKHLTSAAKKAANAAAAKAYRARQKEKKEAWRDPRRLPQSDIIDLSALPPSWHLIRA